MFVIARNLAEARRKAKKYATINQKPKLESGKLFRKGEEKFNTYNFKLKK